MKYVSKLDFYEYIRCVLSISINQWERIPGKEYDIDKMHQIAIEKISCEVQRHGNFDFIL